MKKQHDIQPEETTFVRHLKMQDVYVPEKTWEPERTREISPRVRSGSFGRNLIAVGMVATFMVSSVGITYGKLPGTGAFFMDTETSTLNQFFANFLDFTASSPDTDLKVTPDGAATTTQLTITPIAGSVSTRYHVTASSTGGNLALCNALQVSALSLSPIYSGSLFGLNGTMTSGSLTLSIWLPAPIPNPEIPCTFDIVLRGYDARVTGETGYTDEERISIIVTDPPVPGTETAALTASIDTPEEEAVPPEETPEEPQPESEESPADEPVEENPSAPVLEEPLGE